MEIENTNPAPSKWNTVTPFSKYTAMLIFITIPFVGFWVGMQYAPEKIVIEKENVYLPMETILTEEQKAEAFNETLPIEEGYVKSKYKVVAIVDSPFERGGTAPDSDKITGSTLYVVTYRGTNDYTCGGKHVPGECYFFLESTMADMPALTYVGKWSHTIIDTKQISFIANDTVQFITGEAEVGGDSYQHTWNLDLKTGSTTKVSTKINGVTG